MLLFYHDALEYVEYLFRNPTFTDQINFHPIQLYHNLEQTVRLYTEWMTDIAAWEMQVGTYFSIFSILCTIVTNQTPGQSSIVT